jgi:hypothetical protein
MAIQKKQTKKSAAKKAPAAKKTKTAVKKAQTATKKQLPLTPNSKTHLKAFKDLEKQINDTWEQLRKDVKKNDFQAMIKGRNHLLLLLGECDYMAKEAQRCKETFKAK